METTRGPETLHHITARSHLPNLPKNADNQARVDRPVYAAPARKQTYGYIIIAAVVSFTTGLVIGVFAYRKSMPLCQDQFGLKLNQRVYCVQIGDGPLE